MSDDLAALAADAYIYGFALTFDLQQVSRFSREGMRSLARAPANMRLYQPEPAVLDGTYKIPPITRLAT